jgi:hypothetical protein
MIPPRFVSRNRKGRYWMEPDRHWESKKSDE